MGSTILVADPACVDRDAFCTALASTHYRVVGKCRHGDTLLETVQRLKPWLVAIDLHLPGLSERPGEAAVVVVQRVTDRHPQVNVLVLHDRTNANLVVNAMAAGGTASLRKPLRPETLIETLDKLNNPRGEIASSKMLAVRVKRSVPLSYKGVDEGFFAGKRDALATELGLMSVVMHTEEKLARGRIIAVEIALPGEAPLKAKMQANAVDAVPGLNRFEVTLGYVDMSPEERTRLHAWFRRMLERPSSFPRT
ncbi:MAG: response regulator [Planctomycetes bacterium]|nr:response regulator [Planctomycetota bacterium]